MGRPSSCSFEDESRRSSVFDDTISSHFVNEETRLCVHDGTTTTATDKIMVNLSVASEEIKEEQETDTPRVQAFKL